MDFNHYVVSYEVETRKKQVDAAIDYKKRNCEYFSFLKKDKTAKNKLRFNLFFRNNRIDYCNCDL